MTFPIPFESEYECRNEVFTDYRWETSGTIQYTFNNYGYRTNVNYDANESRPGIYIGSSITSGMGLQFEESYTYQTSVSLNAACYNFAQGCVRVDNKEIVRMLSNVLLVPKFKPLYCVLQFIDLARQYDPTTGKTIELDDRSNNLKRFYSAFEEAESLLSNIPWCFIGNDKDDHAIKESIINHPKCVAWNSKFIDRSVLDNKHPGVRWHKMVALGIDKLMQTQLAG